MLQRAEVSPEREETPAPTTIPGEKTRRGVRIVRLFGWQRMPASSGGIGAASSVTMQPPQKVPERMTSDDHWMRLALEQAHEAGCAGEVPVGAVVVKDGAVIATGRNTPKGSCDPSGHAEINALRAAAAVLGNYRLDDCELFVTLEPCAMCAGAVLHSRLARVVYGAPDPRTGAAGSVVDLFGLVQLNHHTDIRGGVLGEVCSAMLKTFFKQRRQQQRENANPLRDDALRTPESRFTGLMQEPPTSFWSTGGSAQRNWRMHWFDTSANGIGVRATAICLHGPGQWGYLFRNLMTIDDIRWIVPDLIGFGRSDKPKNATVHTWEWHREVLSEWLGEMKIGPVHLVHAAGADPLVQLLRTEPSSLLFDASPICALDERAGDSLNAWQAPFPDRGHEAALRSLGSIHPDSSGPSPEQISKIAEIVRRRC